MIDTRITLDEATVKILFSKYKLFFVPIGIILVSFILFFQVILPQVQEYFSLQSEIKITRGRIAIIQSNIRMLASLDDQGRNVEFVAKVLPWEKDYVGIITSVSMAAIKAGVFVDDFSFSVGDITTLPAGTSQNTSIQLTLRVSGNTQKIKQFISELSKSMPLSEVGNLNLSKDSASLNVSFFYKALPQLQIDYSIPLQPLSYKERETLTMLQSWKSESGSQSGQLSQTPQ